MLKLIRHSDFYGLGIFLTLVVLIGYQEFISPTIGIFILLVIAEALFRRSLQFVFNSGLILFVGLYLLYLMGLLWSNHPEVGWKLMEYKMSFFIFPVLLLFPKTSTDYRAALQGLIWGCLLLGGRFLYEKMTDDAGLTYYEIARQKLNLHPTYTAIYFAGGMSLLCWNIKEKIWQMHWSFVIGLCLLFAYFIFVTGSFAGILFLGMMFALGLGYIIFRLTNRWVAILYAVVAPFLIYFSVTQIKSLQYDLEIINQLKTEIGEGKTVFLEKNKLQVSGTRERVMLWFISAEIIAENPFGVGTGDIDYHLQDKCDKYGLILLKQQNLNPHNQFLQIGIDLGWLGIIYLTFMLIWIFKKAVSGGNWFLLLIVMSLGFNALFESVLQRQSGIVFFTMVISLLLVIEHIKTTETDRLSKTSL